MQCEVAGRTLGSYETASGLPLARLVYPVSTPARTTNTNKKSRKTDGATGRVRFREDFRITRNGGQVKSAGVAARPPARAGRSLLLQSPRSRFLLGKILTADHFPKELTGHRFNHH